MAEDESKRDFHEQSIAGYEVIAKLEDEDAKTFLEYNKRDLTERELASLKESHELYKKHSELNE